jgi:nickel/cobalt transporter (NicO) family protein
MRWRELIVLLLGIVLLLLAQAPASAVEHAQIDAQQAQSAGGNADAVAATPIDPRKLLVRPKKDGAAEPAAPAVWSDPVGWVQVKQRDFYGRMSGTMRAMRGEHSTKAALTLMLLSFLYGVLHAAGPGHGKAVVSAWLLANEREVRRGILIASLSAFFQALTAIVLVSALLLTVSAAGSTARWLAGGLESISYALIALLGLYMIWQALRPYFAAAFVPAPALATADGGHAHGGHEHHAHHDQAHMHDHGHDHSHGHAHHHHHAHGEDCHCGHAHMPGPEQAREASSLGKAVSLAFAVGLRPCTGAILALLFSSAIGLYWAGVASTFVMAIGTAMTVSAIAVIAVTSRGLALRFAGRDSVWLERTTFGLRILGGVAIAAFGTLLFIGSMTGGAQGFS